MSEWFMKPAVYVPRNADDSGVVIPPTPEELAAQELRAQRAAEDGERLRLADEASKASMRRAWEQRLGPLTLYEEALVHLVSMGKGHEALTPIGLLEAMAAIRPAKP